MKAQFKELPSESECLNVKQCANQKAVVMTLASKPVEYLYSKRPPVARTPQPPQVRSVLHSKQRHFAPDRGHLRLCGWVAQKKDTALDKGMYSYVKPV